MISRIFLLHTVFCGLLMLKVFSEPSDELSVVNKIKGRRRRGLGSKNNNSIVSSKKSARPINFNVALCETYEIQWAKDLRYSCPSRCKCIDAERRLKNGEIKCGDKCPDGCDVCDLCLGDILQNHCKASPAKSKGKGGKRIKTKKPSHPPSMYPSQHPSNRPSFEPSKKPTASPSFTPSFLPSGSPSDSPSSNESRRFLMCPTHDWPIGKIRRQLKHKKSSNPSMNPSATPSRQPSIRPSLIPSTTPSLFPTSSPTSSPSFVPSYFPVLSTITVEQVKHAITKVNVALDGFIASDFSKGAQIFDDETATAIQLSTLALSKTLDTDSQYYTTQLIILDDLLHLINTLDVSGDERKAYFSNITSTYFANDVPDFLVEAIERVTSIKNDYKNFLESRRDPEEIARDEYTAQLRKSCNVPHFSPKDIFRYLYGFACGSEGTSQDDCNGVKFDTCLYGSKNELHFSEVAQEALDDFDKFLRRILFETVSLQILCLPLNPSTCTDSFDIVDEVTLGTLELSLKEVNNNLKRAKKCNVAEEEEKEIKGLIPLCVVDSRGYPIPRSSPEYESGTRLYSSDISKQKIKDLDDQDNGSDILGELGRGFEVAQTGIGAGQQLLEVTGKLSDVVNVLKGAGPILQVVSLLLPSPPDPVITFLKEKFEEVNRKLDNLDKKLDQELNDIKLTFANDIIDREIAILQRIKNAYLQYAELQSYRENDNFFILEERYTSNFRYACNNLDFTPADILKNLYGHACGDSNFRRLCPQQPGDVIDFGLSGKCNYGVRKRGYLLEKFYNGSTKAGFQRFSSFLIGAMTEALFLQAVCLPPEINSCPAGSDPIFEAAYNASADALEEVIGNLQEIESCKCPCKVLELLELKLPRDDCSDNNEVDDDDFGKFVEVKSIDTGLTFDAKVSLGKSFSLLPGTQSLEADVYKHFSKFSGIQGTFLSLEEGEVKLSKSKPTGAVAFPMEFLNTFRIEVIEEDTADDRGVCLVYLGNDSYEYQNQLMYSDICNTYERTLDLGDGARVRVKIHPAKSESQLSCSSGFCGENAPICPSGQRCNFDRLKCQ